MATIINRRKWLKNGLLAAGALPLASSFVNNAAARPAFACYPEELISDDAGAIDHFAVEIKARLSANENPFGPSPAAKKAIEGVLDSSYLYPFQQVNALAARITEYEGVKQENLLLSSGSSPILLAAAIHFSKNGGQIITGDPSYDDLPARAQRLGGEWIKVPLTPDHTLDLDAMEKRINSKTSLIYICNPNNPTATVLDADKLRAFCNRVSERVPVMVDEAYIDYLPDPQGASVMSTLKTGKNIIVARTFSKLYGFAGLRVGYCIAQPDMIRTLSAYCPGMMGLSNTSIQAAIASFQEKAFLAEALSKTNQSKAFLYEVLKKEGYEYVPSAANFVIFPIKMDSRQFMSEMNKRGVSIRTWTFNDKNWCRVSIGRMDEMQTFANAFKEIS